MMEIIPVPGIGVVRNTYLRNGIVYASRSDGMATIVWKATTAGWERVGIVDFEQLSGLTVPEVEKQLCTGQGGYTKTVQEMIDRGVIEFTPDLLNKGYHKPINSTEESEAA
jgi:hypothetical protein